MINKASLCVQLLDKQMAKDRRERKSNNKGIGDSLAKDEQVAAA